MMKEYKWRGYQYQIADEDLHLYPGAEPVEPKEKVKEAPANKARQPKGKK